MMTSLQNFFGWGSGDVLAEVQDDVSVGLVQSRRTLFYNRSYGGGVPDYENAPMSLSTMISMRYSVAMLFASRNQIVSSGQNGYPDRRAITSQNNVSVIQDSESALTVLVDYMMMADVMRAHAVQIPVGVTR